MTYIFIISKIQNKGTIESCWKVFYTILEDKVHQWHYLATNHTKYDAHLAVMIC